MNVGVAIMITKNLGLQSGQGLANLYDFCNASRIPQFRQIRLQPLPAGKIHFGSLRPSKLLRTRLKLMRITPLSHQIHYLDPVATNLLDEVPKKGMEDRYLDLSPPKRTHEQKQKELEAKAQHIHEMAQPRTKRK